MAPERSPAQEDTLVSIEHTQLTFEACPASVDSSGRSSALEHGEV